MPRAVEINVGECYERWEVIAPSDERDSGGSVMWLCKCKCGTERLVRGKDLRNKRSRSCGCFSADLSKARMNRSHHEVREILEETLGAGYLYGKRGVVCS